MSARFDSGVLCGSSLQPEGVPSIQEGGDGSNPSCRIRLQLCQDRHAFAAYRQIINTYHTYKRWTHVPGRKIAWLIEDKETDAAVGAIGVASAVMCSKPRDDFIGWNRDQKVHNLRNVANNHRFALIRRGVGSQALSILARVASQEWKRRYGDRLVLLESFVQPPYLGTCYRGANWIYVGQTKGWAVRRLPLSLWKISGGWRQKLYETNRQEAIVRYSQWNRGKHVRAEPTSPKLVFVKPLHRYWKRKLLTNPA